MADLRLTWPEGGRTVAVESTEHTRFVFDFPSADAVVSRDGGDLVFSFSDGAIFRVTDFYTTYHLENMPEFVLDGLAVTGEAFFTALGDEDLMPAADAEALAADARFRDWVDGGLADGLDKMAGLDLDPEEGPSLVRSGSVVEGVSLAGLGGSDITSGAGGAGGPWAAPILSPAPDPVLGLIPIPNLAPDLVPVPAPIRTLTPIPIRTPNLL